MRLGVLDVGSNTVHLLVMDARPGGAPVPAASHKLELRLAELVDPDGSLSREGAEALVDMVAQCARVAEDTGCAELLAFVTSAVREATNGEVVLDAVAERTGVRLRVLSGADEARQTFLAARRWFGWSAGTLVVFDIGGGSLEIAAGRDENPQAAVSVPVGAGRMHRRFGGDLAGMHRYVRAEIGAVVGDVLRCAPFDRAVATSKTFRSLARIAGAAPLADGPYVARRLVRADVSAWVGRLAELSPAKRAALPGVSAGRSAQLLAGAVVAEAVMDLAVVDELDLCPWALREGIMLHALDRLSR